MKDCYKITKVVNVCGTLDADENGEMFISVEDKDDTVAVPFDELINSLLGHKICIKSEEDELV